MTMPISTQHMHAQHNLLDWQEALFHCKERVLLVGVDQFAGSWSSFAVPMGGGRGEREVDQVVIVVDPDVLDRLQIQIVNVGFPPPKATPSIERHRQILPPQGKGCERTFQGQE